MERKVIYIPSDWLPDLARLEARYIALYEEAIKQGAAGTCVHLDIEAHDLATGEIGSVYDFKVIDDLVPDLRAAYMPASPAPKNQAHGPARKGRGGKLRRW